MAFRPASADGLPFSGRTERIAHYLDLSERPGISGKERAGLVLLARTLQKEHTEERIKEYAANPDRLDLAIDIAAKAVRGFRGDPEYQLEVLKKLAAVKDEPILHTILGSTEARCNLPDSRAEHEKAIKECQALFAETKKPEYIELAVAIASGSLHQSSLALGIADRAIERSPEDQSLYEIRGALHETMGSWVLAVQDYDRALSMLVQAVPNIESYDQQFSHEMRINDLVRRLRLLSGLANAEHDRHIARGVSEAQSE